MTTELLSEELLSDIYWNSDIAYPYADVVHPYTPFYYVSKWRVADSPAVVVGDSAFVLSDWCMDDFNHHMVYVWTEYTATIGSKIEWTQSSLKTRGTEAEVRAAFQSWLNGLDLTRAKAAAIYMEALRQLVPAQEYLADAQRVMDWAEQCVDSTRNAYLECLRTE